MFLLSNLFCVAYLAHTVFGQSSDSEDECTAQELWSASFADIGFPHQMSYSPLFDVYLVGNAKHSTPSNVAGVYVVPNELESYLLIENDFGHGFGIFDNYLLISAGTDVIIYTMSVSNEEPNANQLQVEELMTLSLGDTTNPDALISRVCVDYDGGFIYAQDAGWKFGPNPYDTQTAAIWQIDVQNEFSVKTVYQYDSILNSVNPIAHGCTIDSQGYLYYMNKEFVAGTSTIISRLNPLLDSSEEILGSIQDLPDSGTNIFPFDLTFDKDDRLYLSNFGSYVFGERLEIGTIVTFDKPSEYLDESSESSSNSGSSGSGNIPNWETLIDGISVPSGIRMDKDNNELLIPIRFQNFDGLTVRVYSVDC